MTDRVTDEVTDSEKRILNYLEIDPGYSYTMLSDMLGVIRTNYSGT